MRTRYLIAFVPILLAASGCTDSVEKIKAENRTLQEYINERRTALEYLESQAAVAAGCDYVVPLCPAITVQTGRDALARGIGGGASFYFWLALCGKLMALAAAAATFAATMQFLWIRLGQPAAVAVRDAERVIAQSSASEEDAKQYVAAAQVALDRLVTDAAARQEELNETLQSLSFAHKDLAELNIQIEHLRNVRQALISFQRKP